MSKLRSFLLWNINCFTLPSSSYIRDLWALSIITKRNFHRYKNLSAAITPWLNKFDPCLLTVERPSNPAKILYSERLDTSAWYIVYLFTLLACTLHITLEASTYDHELWEFFAPDVCLYEGLISVTNICLSYQQLHTYTMRCVSYVRIAIKYTNSSGLPWDKIKETRSPFFFLYLLPPVLAPSPGNSFNISFSCILVSNYESEAMITNTERSLCLIFGCSNCRLPLQLS